MSVSSAMGAVAGGFGAAWTTIQAIIKAGVSSGAMQAIAAGIATLAAKGDAKEHSLRKNCALAVAEIVEFEPEEDDIEALTNAIARLSYVLEQKLKEQQLSKDKAGA